MDTNTNSNVKLSNVIGAPFSSYVLLQLYQRAAHNSTVNRSTEDVLFLANKTGWARLVSSVNIELQPTSNTGLTDQDYQTYYGRFNLNSTLSYNAPDSLAKNWVLEAGTSIQNGDGINLRSGIGPDGAYGLGGTEELGYRPMPGLTGVTVETTGRLGSLRQANIQFKVWNMNQLNVVEALYFRLGYSMLLEWGHTQYFENTGNFQRNAFGIDDPFIKGKRKERIQQDVAKRSRATFGNYDGMLGIVSNFNWSMNQDGGFDCTVKLVGLGSVMDSMRINQAYKLPDGLVKEYKKNKDAITQLIAERAAKKALEDYKRNNPTPPGAKVEVIDPVPKSPVELKERLRSYDNYQKFAVTDIQQDYGIPFYNKTENFTAARAQGGYDYYTPFSNVTADNIKSKVISTYAGLWLNQGGQIGWARIPLDGVDTAVVATNLLNYAAETAIIITSEGEKTINQLEVGKKEGSSLSKYFEYSTQTYITGPSGPGGSISTQDVPLTSKVNPAASELNVTVGGLRSPNGSIGSTSFSIKVNPITDAADKYFQPTRGELIKVLDLWQNQSNSIITGVKVKSTGANSVLITGKITGTPVEARYNGPDPDRANVIKGNGGKETRLVTPTFTFSTTNPGFLSLIGAPTQSSSNATSQTAQNANAGDTNGAANTDNATQTQAAEGFASALEAMLTVVQAEAQFKIGKATVKGLAIPIRGITEKFFQDGIMNGVLNSDSIPKTTLNLEEKQFLLAYASKGFNSNLMVDPSLYDIIPSVNFDNLCKVFAFAYGQGGDAGDPSELYSPTYISFGYLLAFLNNMCLIYDSPDSKLSTNNNPTTGTPKRPYVYIDFNPETNFCLTSPQQLSVDPYTCLVPLQATQAEYKTIFPKNIADHWRSESTVTPIFDPGGTFNGVSTVIANAGTPYKTPADAYQGRIMDILLNIDYLLGLVRSSAGADPEHAVKLEPFLQQILQDVNKALGNTNAFRAAYRDDSNTIQIQDDQWVPSLNGTEASMLNQKSYSSKLAEGNDRQIAGLLPITSDPQELPVAGTLSLARQFQLRSVMSTKLASMIAISAQANTGSVNATDHSSLSYLNENFQDRYKPYIQDASNGESGTNVNSKNGSGNSESNDQKAAELFNDHIINIYSNFNLSADRIGLAKNYYIERMSKVKSGDPVVAAAPFIPAELEMTIDGISGIIMGNAFTVPQDRLPLSLRGKNGLAKIAFIVTGLTHTIQNNEWLTRIKGQMIKLREEVKQVTAATLIGEIQKQIPQPLTGGDIPTLSQDFNNKNPWSAAFISYVMIEAGLSNFPASQGHTGYAQALRRNNIGFEILDPSKTKVQVGDIVIANREGNNMTFATKTWSGYSHGDIISNISGNTATGIGGNVSQSVATKSIGLVDGKLGKSDYFVILRPPQGSVSRIVNVATTQYNLWKTNQWKETSPGALPYLREYYKTVGIKI